MKIKSFLYRNALSVTFLLLAVFSIAGQAVTGWKEHNSFLEEHHQSAQAFSGYLTSGHFLQATFENWESEFFQMMLFVILTIFLRQEGSSESVPMEGESKKKNETRPKADSPAMLKKGGIAARIYGHSLSIVLGILFVVSFLLHWYGSWKDENLERSLEGQQTIDLLPFLGSSKFWFESFQNWQSEFLSIFAIVYLSIYLRQKGSPQSKAVNAPHDETGE